MSKKIILLNGSPRIKNSSSNMIAEYIEDKYSKKGILTEIIKINSYLDNEKNKKIFINKINKSNIIFLIFPLYIDSLPYNVIESLEFIKENISIIEENKHKTFIAISHSGLAAEKNQAAIKICECFANDMKYNFGRGFMMGYSSVLNGNSLESLNRMTKKFQKALEIIVDSTSKNEIIPSKVQKLMMKPFIPGPQFIVKPLLNFVMRDCYKQKDFIKGINNIRSKLKVFYS